MAATAERPEFNVFRRFFLDPSGPTVPVDAARTDFNLFLRIATAFIVFVLSLVAAGIAVELISTERAKDTWSSLIATPLSARQILLGKPLRVDVASPRAGWNAQFALDARPSFRRDSSFRMPGGDFDHGRVYGVLCESRPPGRAQKAGPLGHKRRSPGPDLDAALLGPMPVELDGSVVGHLDVTEIFS